MSEFVWRDHPLFVAGRWRECKVPRIDSEPARDDVESTVLLYRPYGHSGRRPERAAGDQGSGSAAGHRVARAHSRPDHRRIASYLHARLHEPVGDVQGHPAQHGVAGGRACPGCLAGPGEDGRRPVGAPRAGGAARSWPRAGPAQRRGLHSRGEADDRGVLGQGRRRQVHRHREPGGGAAPGRRRRRHHRLRRLRPGHSAHARLARPAGDVREPDHPRRGARHEDDVDRPARERARAPGLARPDDSLLHPADAEGRHVGGARLPRLRHAARDRRRAALPLASHPALGRRDGDHASGGRPARRAQGDRACSRSSTCRSSASSRT